MGITYVSNQRDPEWRAAADTLHLVVEVHRRDYDRAVVVGTACGLHIVPSARDFRLNEMDSEEIGSKIPVCRPCRALEPTARANAAHTARLS